jgi:hypothetical protein
VAGQLEPPVWCCSLLREKFLAFLGTCGGCGSTCGYRMEMKRGMGISNIVELLLGKSCRAGFLGLGDGWG